MSGRAGTHRLSLRHLAERASRDVVLRRRLPVELGGHRVLVTPDASLRFWLPGLYRRDAMFVDRCRELLRPGDAVWDVGADVGLFAYAAAWFSGAQGEVLALEPDPWLAALLRRSAGALPAAFAPIEVSELAVADRSGPSSFAVASRGRATSHLSEVAGSTQSGGSRGTITVQATTLDRLLAKRRAPRLVKIDVEGAELLCLRGAADLLCDARPVLLCEVDAPNRQAIGELLAAAGYQLFDAEAAPAERQPLAEPAWNTLAIPR
ncbi:MAG TPA: FkbM family methyltransferase [Thermoanaerobaculia bacterium]|nr:FkbM family methyltransferase [Thermoanaerobaculia bacterium]